MAKKARLNLTAIHLNYYLNRPQVYHKISGKTSLIFTLGHPNFTLKV